MMTLFTNERHMASLAMAQWVENFKSRRSFWIMLFGQRPVLRKHLLLKTTENKYDLNL